MFIYNSRLKFRKIIIISNESKTAKYIFNYNKVLQTILSQDKYYNHINIRLPRHSKSSIMFT